MKSISKIVSSLLLIILIMTIAFSLRSNATYDKYNPYDFTSVEGSEKAQQATIDAAGAIIVIVRMATAVIAVVMLLIIAARYMISAPGERADIKKHAIPYVVGAVILFGTSGILTIIGKLADEFSALG